jgi:AraC-like DNA-binding protein
LIVVHRTIDGAFTDETMLPDAAGNPAAWPSVTVIIDGAVITADPTGHCERVLSRGAIHATRDWRRHRVRSLTPRTEMLSLIWRAAGALGSLRSPGLPRSPASTQGTADRIDDRALAHVDRIARSMRMREGDPSHHESREALVGELLAPLAHAGVDIDPSGYSAVRAWSAPDLEPVARVLEAVMSPMSNRPAAIDVARLLGCGERQALRRMNEYIRRMHVTVRSWREYVFDIRLFVALLAMGCPKGKLNEVASWVGFSSATSLCHAFTNANLPSPGEARDSLLTLGEGLFRPIQHQAREAI